MNWDWDKLQEKRQRQGRGPVNNPRGGDEEPASSEGKKPDFGNVSGMFKRMSGMRGGGWLLLVAVGVWLLSGIYIVNPDEQGVILRFGKYNRTVESGPHYALPYPIETRFTPKVTQVRRVEVGFRSMMQGSTFQQGANRAVPEEASMLTGDENIVNVQFSVQYRIKDPVEYLFNVSNPEAVVKSAAEAAMREVIGNSLIDSALTDGKLQIQTEATQLLQEILDRYKMGVQVLAVQLQNVHPPQEVSDAFKDVASAREDKSRIINEAEAYRNELLPKARGQAAAVENEAEAYKETRVRGAEGESARFLALLKEYEQAQDVTKKRLYLEAMEEILSRPGMEKIVLPKEVSGRALPLLPLLSAGNADAARPVPENSPSTDERALPPGLDKGQARGQDKGGK